MRREFLFEAKKRARVAPLVLILCALCVTLVPASHARQEGRPRRVNAAPRSAVSAQQQAAQQKTPATQTTSGTSSAQAKQTPTPAPQSNGSQSQTTGNRPKLQTSPSAAPDEQTGKDASGQEVNEDEVVRTDVNLVNLHVRVVDRFNRPINDVRQDEFKVFENNVPQEISFVSREEVPITYGLVVDNSGSLRSQINQVIDAGKTIINSNKPGDETFVVRFIDRENIKIMQDFTADKQSLNDALDDMYIDGGQTAVIDAVYLSAEHAAERRKNDPADEKRRRAIILVTDGEDRESFYNQEKLFESLKEEDVQIFVIGFVNELDKDRGFITKSKRDKAISLLDRMATETGGRTFYPTSLSELPQIAEEITKDLRTQYVISYKPSVIAKAGEYRPVRVTVADAPGREKRIAVTRSGYTGKEANSGAAQPQANKSPSTVRRQ